MLNTLNHQGKQIITALRLHLSPEDKQENASWDAEKRAPLDTTGWKCNLLLLLCQWGGGSSKIELHVTQLYLFWLFTQRTPGQHATNYVCCCFAHNS